MDASALHNASSSETEPQTDDKVDETVEVSLKRKRFECFEWNEEAAAEWGTKLADFSDYF